MRLVRFNVERVVESQAEIAALKAEGFVELPAKKEKVEKNDTTRPAKEKNRE